MTIYFQHVGAENAARDFPRSLLLADGTPVKFSLEDVTPYLSHLSKEELSSIESELGGNTFQIWGLPAGAKTIVAKMKKEDYLLLIPLASSDGGVTYACRRRTNPILFGDELSEHVWGNGKFSCIVLVDGSPVSLPWDAFLGSLNYAPNWRPAGQTYPIKADRLQHSDYKDEPGLLRELGLGPVYKEPALSPGNPADGFADEGFDEGARRLMLHEQIERSSAAVAAFKASLTEYRCEICNFDFESTYGKLGEGYIEAHHRVPLSSLKGQVATKVSDFAAVCANCHRMLHRGGVITEVQVLKDAMKKPT